MHYLPSPTLLELSTNVYSVNISACPAQCLHPFSPPQLVFSFKKRVNCIVDSTVSSVYETIEILVIFPLFSIDFFLSGSTLHRLQYWQQFLTPPWSFLDAPPHLTSDEMTTDYTFVCADTYACAMDARACVRAVCARA